MLLIWHIFIFLLKLIICIYAISAWLKYTTDSIDYNKMICTSDIHNSMASKKTD